MIAAILAAMGLTRSATHANPSHGPVRRARWRGTDGRWQWAAV